MYISNIYDSDDLYMLASEKMIDVYLIKYICNVLLNNVVIFQMFDDIKIYVFG